MLCFWSQATVIKTLVKGSESNYAMQNLMLIKIVMLTIHTTLT